MILVLLKVGVVGVIGLDGILIEDIVLVVGEDIIKDKIFVEEVKNIIFEIKNWCKFFYKF